MERVRMGRALERLLREGGLREGALIGAALAAGSHDVAAGDRAAARHAGLGASAAISSFLRTSSCSSRSIFWNRRSLVRRRK